MGSFKFHCPYCEHEIEAKDEWIDQKSTCPICNEEIIVAKDLSFDDISCSNAEKKSISKVPVCNPLTDKNPNAVNKHNGEISPRAISTGDRKSSKVHGDENVESPKQGMLTDYKYSSCPYCGEKILSEAKKCRYCGEFIDCLATKKSNTTTYFMKNKIYILILSVIVAVISIWGIVEYLKYEKNIREKRNVFSLKYEAFRGNLLKLMDQGSQLNVMIKNGITLKEFTSAVNALESSFSRTQESIPAELKNSKEFVIATENIEEAFLAWRIANALWTFKIQYVSKSDYLKTLIQSDYGSDICWDSKENPKLYKLIDSYLSPHLKSECYNSQSFGSTIVYLKTINVLLAVAGDYYKSAHENLLLLQKKQDEKLSKGEFP